MYSRNNNSIVGLDIDDDDERSLVSELEVKKVALNDDDYGEHIKLQEVDDNGNDDYYYYYYYNDEVTNNLYSTSEKTQARVIIITI